MTMEIELEHENLTSYERGHAENIYVVCIAQTIKDAQYLPTSELRQYLIERFVETWLDLFATYCESSFESVANSRRAYSAFNYANQTLGVLGGARKLVQELHIEQPSDEFMYKLSAAVDSLIVSFTMQPVSIPATQLSPKL